MPLPCFTDDDDVQDALFEVRAAWLHLRQTVRALPASDGRQQLFIQMDTAAVRWKGLQDVVQLQKILMVLTHIVSQRRLDEAVQESIDGVHEKLDAVWAILKHDEWM